MISIITPTYNTAPDVLARTWESVKSQSHTDWEWVIWDDSTTDAVRNFINPLTDDYDYNVRMFMGSKHDGVIGSVKRRAFSMGVGDILVELDHDDELRPNALSEIQKCFDNNPDVGFVYSNWCEFDAEGNPRKYPKGWALGLGRDYWMPSIGAWCIVPPLLTAETVLNIGTAPNHVRAWRTSTYMQIGGHDPTMPILDDLDLIIRTFMATKTMHINKVLYVQHFGDHNSQTMFRQAIHQWTPVLDEKYRAAIMSAR